MSLREHRIKGEKKNTLPQNPELSLSKIPALHCLHPLFDQSFKLHYFRRITVIDIITRKSSSRTKLHWYHLLRIHTRIFILLFESWLATSFPVSDPNFKLLYLRLGCKVRVIWSVVRKKNTHTLARCTITDARCDQSFFWLSSTEIADQAVYAGSLTHVFAYTYNWIYRSVRAENLWPWNTCRCSLILYDLPILLKYYQPLLYNN